MPRPSGSVTHAGEAGAPLGASEQQDANREKPEAFEASEGSGVGIAAVETMVEVVARLWSIS